MDVTLTIPNDKAALIVDAFCELGNYQDEIDVIDDVTKEISQIPNPETKAQFTKRQIIGLIKKTVKRHLHQTDETIFNTMLIEKKKTIDEIDIS